MIAKNVFIISTTLWAVLWILAIIQISMDERARGIKSGDKDPDWEPDCGTGFCIGGGLFSAVVALISGVTLILRAI